MADTVKHALRFPEGLFLLTQNDGLYFLPDGHDTAYQCYGEKKELHGKIVRTMKSTDPAVKSYDLAYEFDEGELLSARLVTRTTRSKGMLADAKETTDIVRRLADGRIKLRSVHEAPTIYGACRMADGDMLLHVYNLPGHKYYSLLRGQPGAYKLLDIAQGVQGGNSHCYTLKDGTAVELNWQDKQFRNVWTFGGQPMQPLPLTYSEKDLATHGLQMADIGPHLDPFSPELRKAPPAPRGPAPKGP